MVGYGPEDDHFVIELTYNYEIGSYRLGNDFMVSCDFNVVVLKRPGYRHQTQKNEFPWSPAYKDTSRC